MTEDGGAPTAAAPVVMGTLGRVEEYEHHKEDWPQYVERLSHFFEANAITTPERKRSVFLAVVGATTYKVLRDLVAPSKPGDIPFEELVQKLEEHFSPKPSEIVERFRFHTRTRKPGESVANFIASLRALSEHCNFGTVHCTSYNMVMCLLKHYVIVFLPNVKSHSSTSQMVVVCLFIDRHLSKPLSVKASIGLLQLTGF